MLTFVINNPLVYALAFPIIGILLLLPVSFRREKLLKLIALNVAFISFFSSLLVCGFFQKSVGSFQFVTKFAWIPALNLNFVFGVDGISLFFLFLTTMLIPLCILASWNSVSFSVKEFLIAFLILDFFLVGTFCVLDLLLFYVFFESVLIPMFFIIGIWGSRERKILAAYYFFIYTLLGSVFVFFVFINVFFVTGSSNFDIFFNYFFSSDRVFYF